MLLARLRLKHGFAADLLDSDEAPPRVPAPRAPGVRRWGKNRHVWQSCVCAMCQGRRDGRIGPGYEDQAVRG